MAVTLTAPLTNQDIDRALANVADAIIGAATLLDQTVDYWGEALTQENLDGGMLVTLGGPDAVPWTPEQFQRYILYVGQTYNVLQALVTGSPPPVNLVQPWSAQFRPGGQQP